LANELTEKVERQDAKHITGKYISRVGVNCEDWIYADGVHYLKSRCKKNKKRWGPSIPKMAT